MPQSEAETELREWAKTMLAAEPVMPMLPVAEPELEQSVEESEDAKAEAEFKEFMEKFHKKEGPTTEEDLDKIAAFFGIDAEDLEKFKQEWVAESSVSNYLDWTNAVEEARTVDPDVAPTEEREPHPDLDPEVVVALSEPISLEEAYAREMAADQDEELRRLEADMDAVGDRNILLALLEENPTLLEEIMRAYDEAKAETETSTPQAATNRPVNWFEAMNPPNPSRKN
jgi:hypothetical protein